MHWLNTSKCIILHDHFTIIPNHTHSIVAFDLLIPVCRRTLKVVWSFSCGSGTCMNLQCFVHLLWTFLILTHRHILSLDALIGVSHASDGGIVIPLPRALEASVSIEGSWGLVTTCDNSDSTSASVYCNPSEPNRSVIKNGAAKRLLWILHLPDFTDASHLKRILQCIPQTIAMPFYLKHPETIFQNNRTYSKYSGVSFSLASLALGLWGQVGCEPTQALSAVQCSFWRAHSRCMSCCYWALGAQVQWPGACSGDLTKSQQSKAPLDTLALRVVGGCKQLEFRCAALEVQRDSGDLRVAGCCRRVVSRKITHRLKSFNPTKTLSRGCQPVKSDQKSFHANKPRLGLQSLQGFVQSSFFFWALVLILRTYNVGVLRAQSNKNTTKINNISSELYTSACAQTYVATPSLLTWNVILLQNKLLLCKLFFFL